MTKRAKIAKHFAAMRKRAAEPQAKRILTEADIQDMISREVARQLADSFRALGRTPSWRGGCG